MNHCSRFTCFRLSGVLCCLLSIVIVCLNIQKAVAQQDISSKNMLKKLTPITPEAASLGKYDAVPVSLYTGIPNISIPLYEVEVGDFKLPISLSYHAGGIRVEDIASCVGLGWTLNAGGVINRQPRGVPDEAMIDNYNSYKDDIAKMNDPAVNSDTKLAIAAKWGASGSSTNAYDTEPDLFSFSFLGKAGKFFHDPQGNVYMMPVDNKLAVKHEGVYYITTNNKYRWARWIVTDNTGIKYVFGRSLDGLSDNLEQTCNVGGGMYCDDNTSVNSWFLSEVILTDGRKVTFSYDVSNYSVNNTPVYTSAFPNTCAVYGGISNANTYNQYQRALRLREISFPGGKISFIPGANREDLPSEKFIDKVEIYKSAKVGGILSYALIKSFKLSYLNSGRLRLLSVGETDINSGQVVKSHTFSYNAVSLPERSSTSQDLWGYYNGQSNSTLAPEVYYSANGSSVYMTGANRAVDPNYTQAEMLTGITYPTGGKAYFQYENNTYKCGPSEQSQTLCEVLNSTSAFPVKNSIINYTSENLGSSNYTTYSKDFALKAVAGSRMKRSVKFSGRYLPYDNATCTRMDMTGGGSKYLCIEADLERKLPDNSYVKVIGGLTFGINFELEPSLGDTFRLVVKWSNSYNGMFYVDTYYSYEDVSPQLDIAKGERFAGGLRIKKIVNYDPVSGDSLIKTYEYKYNEDDGNALNGATSGVIMNIPVIRYNQPYCNQEAGYMCANMEGITSRPSSNILSSDGINVGYKKVVEYAGKDGKNGRSISYFTTALDYTDTNLFNSTRFPFPEARSYAWKRGLETEKNDYKNSGSEIRLAQSAINSYLFGVDNYTELNAIKIVQLPALQLSPAGNLCGFGFVHTDYKIGTESFYLSKNISRQYTDNGIFLEKTTSFVQNPKCLQTSNIQTPESDGSVINTKVTYPLDYDITATSLSTEAAGVKNLITNNVVTIPVEKITMKKGTDGKEVVTDGMITIFYPDKPLVSKIYVLKQQNIPVNEFVFSKVDGSGSFIKDSRYEERFVFNKYDQQNNLLEQYKKDDIKECYLWGYDNKYPVAKITGAGYDAVAGLVNQAVLQEPANDKAIRDEINRIRVQVPGAMVTAYTYLPLIGITSETAPNGMTTYYEYDALGRLQIIRNNDGKIIKQYNYQYNAAVTQ